MVCPRQKLKSHWAINCRHVGVLESRIQAVRTGRSVLTTWVGVLRSECFKRLVFYDSINCAFWQYLSCNISANPTQVLWYSYWYTALRCVLQLDFIQISILYSKSQRTILIELRAKDSRHVSHCPRATIAKLLGLNSITFEWIWICI